MNRKDRRRAEAHRKCGMCSLCCKLIAVVALNKPIDTWCPHARPGRGGCSIYADRPSSCRSYICGWLSGSPEFGDEWFPARCKMVLAPINPGRTIREGGILVVVDPAYSNAWRREPYHSQIQAWAQKIRVEIRVGRNFFELNADGTEREVSRLLASEFLIANRAPDPEVKR